ncbi:MAG: ATP-binding protein [Selenomonas sp.]|uniref:ATP-binding protein n=1 Tax=Selenomonas sp. TaxID=2053611 RepID=UPI0025E9BE62|nr:ATP-binding protein [Selenomonas sp.]MCR5758102.1 ATP-binding protein [Selenomonas sp.]
MENDTARELVIEAQLDNLPKLNGFVEEMLAPLLPSMKVQMQLELAVEEIFVNIVNYAYGEGTGKVVVQAKTKGGPRSIELLFQDEGVPYNPLEREEPDPEQSLEERGIGGWGIFLVKKNVDEVTYAYTQKKNNLTIRKNIF